LIKSLSARRSSTQAAEAEAVLALLGKRKEIMIVESIGSVLKKKGQDISSVAPGATVHEAIALMATNNVGAVLVISEGSLVGIITIRDFGRKVVLEGKSAREVRVQEIMTSSLITVTPETNVLKAMAMMTDHHIRHLPVLEHGELSGIVSMADLVNEVVTGQAFVIDQLQRYIGQV
jgi:CBS domain-containing protein